MNHGAWNGKGQRRGGRKTNSTGLCDALLTLIAASTGGLRHSTILEFWVRPDLGEPRMEPPRGPNPMGGSSKPRPPKSGQTPALDSHLRRLQREGRIVVMDTPTGRRWATPEAAALIGAAA